MKKFAFPKSAKLCGQLLIQSLYKTGRNVVVPPLRFTFRKEAKDETGEPVKVLVWAGKRLFKRANRRNRLKRLLREAYRLNACGLKEKVSRTDYTVVVAINYIEKKELPYKIIETAMTKGLSTIAERLGF